MKNYDAIVVGTGNSGLFSALSLINEGLKVLLLDEHNNIGGMSGYSKIGRFEFGNSIHNLYLGSESVSDYKLEKVLEQCGVYDEIKLSEVPNLFRVITRDHDFVMPFGIEEFTKKLNELVPDSIEAVNIFFELALECREAMKYVKENYKNVDYNYLKEKYINFLKVSCYSVSKVLDAIGMPLEAQEIINSMWSFLGNSETQISFVTYATFLLDLIQYGYSVPTYNNYDISLTLLNSYLERGGELKLNSRVVKILTDDNKVNGVKLEDGTLYYSNNVIVNSSLNNVYGKLLDPSVVPREAFKNVNRRKLGGRTLTINLGLNRSAEELGLNNYTYLLYQSLDSDVEYSRMKELLSGNQIAIVHNIANKDISPVGTCALSLTTIYFEDCFGEYVENERYFTDVKEISQRLIDIFEKYTKVKITDYIEEMEIVSPVNNAMVNDYPEGCTYGYLLDGDDDMLPRILNKDKENYIEGLFVCGGFDGDVYNYNSSIMSGIDCKDAIMNNIREEENGR